MIGKETQSFLCPLGQSGQSHKVDVVQEIIH